MPRPNLAWLIEPPSSDPIVDRPDSGMYAEVRHGGVVRYFNKLPATWNGITRFHRLTPAQRAAYGILPVVDVTPAVNSNTQRPARTSPSAVIYGDRVEISRAMEPLTEQEIADRAAARSAEGVRAARTAALNVLDEQRLAVAASESGTPDAIRKYRQEIEATDPDRLGRALRLGGPARVERRIRQLAEKDPVSALLIKGGLK